MVFKIKIQLKQLLLFSSLFSFVLVSCKNDLKNAKLISKDEFNHSVEITKEVKILMSEKGSTKFIMEAKEMQYHMLDSSYYEMNEGLEISIYNQKENKVGNVKGGYGKKLIKTDLFFIKKEVVAINAKGEEFSSDELIWDGTSQKFYSNKKVKIVLKDGTVIFGKDFWCNKDFSYYEISQSSGDINFDEEL